LKKVTIIVEKGLGFKLFLGFKPFLGFKLFLCREKRKLPAAALQTESALFSVFPQITVL